MDEDLMSKIRELCVMRDENEERVKRRIQELRNEYLFGHGSTKSFDERMADKYGNAVKEFVNRNNSSVVESVDTKMDRDAIVADMIRKVGRDIRVIGYLTEDESYWDTVDEAIVTNGIRLRMMRNYGIGYERSMRFRELFNRLKTMA
jgi:hypothetical protein